MNYTAYCTALTEQVSVHQQLLDQIRTIRQLGLPERSDAASSATQLLEQSPCPGVTKDEIRGAIGMRNAIVHDYLNLDWALIEQVIRNGQYRILTLFVEHYSELLCSDDGS